MGDFDPYHKWLGIPPPEQPPNHYRLLGITLFESDPDVIDAAADQRMTFVRHCTTGPHLEASQKLLNEVASARLCLLKPAERARYDAELKAKMVSPPAGGSMWDSSFPAEPPAIANVHDAVGSPFDFQVEKPSSHILGRQKRAAPSRMPLIAAGVGVALLLVCCAVGIYLREPTKPVSAPRFSAQDDHQQPDGESTDGKAEPIEPGAPPYGEQIAARPQPQSSPLPPVGDSLAPKPPPTEPPPATVFETPADESGPIRNDRPGKTVGGRDSAGWVDLLGWATKKGDWWPGALERPPGADGVTLASAPFNRVVLPAIIDGDYELEVAFTRHSGNLGVVVCFPVGSHNMHLHMGFLKGHKAGVGWIDGKGFSKDRNPTIRDIKPFKNDEKHRVCIRVRHDGDDASFNIDLDEVRDFIQWRGAYAALTDLTGDGWKISSLRQPWIGAYESRVTFHNVRARSTSSAGGIRPEFITDEDRQRDRERGLVRLVGEKPVSQPRVGWGTFEINRIPLTAAAGETERSWPLVTEDPVFCPDFWCAHATSRLHCPIPRGAKSFTVFGYNDCSRHSKYAVSIDGRQVYQSSVTDFAKVKVAIPAEATVLELIIDNAGNFNGDDTFWCHARYHKIAAESVTDQMLDGKVQSDALEFVVDPSPNVSSVGFDKLAHNQPMAARKAIPLEYRCLRPCDEFLFAHASSMVGFEVPQGMTRFTAIGYCVWSVDVKYSVWADGQLLQEFPPARIFPINITLPSRTHLIELRVEDNGNNKNDRSMWCYPRLHRK